MTDETYLKMVLALPEEFFEGWKLKDGDQVFLIDEIDDYASSAEHGLYTVVGDLLAHNGVNDTENWHYWTWMLQDGLIRPIPTQEQLQEMILSHWKKSAWTGYTYFHVFSEFRLYIFETLDSVENLIGDKTTISEMWLMFVMHDLYKKEWNGEDWV